MFTSLQEVVVDSMAENNTPKDSFICGRCGFSCKFDYYGKTPPFSKSITILEDAYVLKDPFCDEQKCIIVGSLCTSCNNPVCVSQECSLFYAKRFCVQCILADLDQFPKEIQSSPLYVLNWPPTNPQTARPYLVTIITGSRRGAGTTGNVAFTLKGNAGESALQEISSDFIKNDKNLFHRGAVNDFLVFTEEPLGILEYASVHLSTDTSYETWFACYMTVTDLRNKGKRYYFTLHRWLVASGGVDGHTMHFMKPAGNSLQQVMDNVLLCLRELHIGLAPWTSRLLSCRLDSFLSLSLCTLVVVCFLLNSALTFAVPMTLNSFDHTVALTVLVVIVVTLFVSLVQLVARMIRSDDGFRLNGYMAVNIRLVRNSSATYSRSNDAALSSRHLQALQAAAATGTGPSPYTGGGSVIGRNVTGNNSLPLGATKPNRVHRRMLETNNTSSPWYHSHRVSLSDRQNQVNNNYNDNSSNNNNALCRMCDCSVAAERDLRRNRLLPNVDNKFEQWCRNSHIDQMSLWTLSYDACGHADDRDPVDNFQLQSPEWPILPHGGYGENLNSNNSNNNTDVGNGGPVHCEMTSVSVLTAGSAALTEVDSDVTVAMNSRLVSNWNVNNNGGSEQVPPRGKVSSTDASGSGQPDRRTTPVGDNEVGASQYISGAGKETIHTSSPSSPSYQPLAPTRSADVGTRFSSVPSIPDPVRGNYRHFRRWGGPSMTDFRRPDRHPASRYNLLQASRTHDSKDFPVLDSRMLPKTVCGCCGQSSIVSYNEYSKSSYLRFLDRRSAPGPSQATPANVSSSDRFQVMKDTWAPGFRYKGQYPDEFWYYRYHANRFASSNNGRGVGEQVPAIGKPYANFSQQRMSPSSHSRSFNYYHEDTKSSYKTYGPKRLGPRFGMTSKKMADKSTSAPEVDVETLAEALPLKNDETETSGGGTGGTNLKAVQLKDSNPGSFTENWNALWESVGPLMNDDVPVVCVTTTSSASSKRNISGNAVVDILNSPSAMTMTSSPRLGSIPDLKDFTGSMADLKVFTGQLVQNVISQLKTCAARYHLPTASPENASVAALGGDKRKRGKHTEHENGSCTPTGCCLRSAKEHRSKSENKSKNARTQSAVSAKTDSSMNSKGNNNKATITSSIKRLWADILTNVMYQNTMGQRGNVDHCAASSGRQHYSDQYQRGADLLNVFHYDENDDYDDTASSTAATDVGCCHSHQRHNSRHHHFIADRHRRHRPSTAVPFISASVDSALIADKDVMEDQRHVKRSAADTIGNAENKYGDYSDDDSQQLDDDDEDRWLRQFAASVVDKLYNAMSTKLEQVRADNPSAGDADLLDLASAELQTDLMPQILEHVTGAIKDDCQDGRHVDPKEAAKRLIKSIISNSVLSIRNKSKTQHGRRRSEVPTKKAFVVMSNATTTSTTTNNGSKGKNSSSSNNNNRRKDTADGSEVVSPSRVAWAATRLRHNVPPGDHLHRHRRRCSTDEYEKNPIDQVDSHQKRKVSSWMMMAAQHQPSNAIYESGEDEAVSDNVSQYSTPTASSKTGSSYSSVSGNTSDDDEVSSISDCEIVKYNKGHCQKGGDGKITRRCRGVRNADDLLVRSIVAVSELRHEMNKFQRQPPDGWLAARKEVGVGQNMKATVQSVPRPEFGSCISPIEAREGLHLTATSEDKSKTGRYDGQRSRILSAAERRPKRRYGCPSTPRRSNARLIKGSTSTPRRTQMYEKTDQQQPVRSRRGRDSTKEDKSERKSTNNSRKECEGTLTRKGDWRQVPERFRLDQGSSTDINSSNNNNNNKNNNINNTTVFHGLGEETADSNEKNGYRRINLNNARRRGQSQIQSESRQFDARFSPMFGGFRKRSYRSKLPRNGPGSNGGVWWAAETRTELTDSTSSDDNDDGTVGSFSSKATTQPEALLLDVTCLAVEVDDFVQLQRLKANCTSPDVEIAVAMDIERLRRCYVEELRNPTLLNNSNNVGNYNTNASSNETQLTLQQSRNLTATATSAPDDFVARTGSDYIETDPSSSTSSPRRIPPSAVDVNALTRFWDEDRKRGPGDDWRHSAGPIFYGILVALVVLLILTFTLVYVAIGARLDTIQALHWLMASALVIAVDIFLVEPLRVVVVALYWAVVRHDLMPSI